MLDLILRGGTLAGGQGMADIGIENGRIVAIEPRLDAGAGHEIDCAGRLVTPPFVDPHFHMDATLSLGRPRLNESGTLLEGIGLWGELKPLLTHDDVKTRGLQACRWAIAQGCLAIRSHVDVCDPNLVAVQALLEVRREIAPWLDLQLVAFPQDGLYRFEGAEDLLLRALDLGVDVVGGIPHFERTEEEGRASVRRLCELAAGGGLLLDLHCDETDDPNSRHVETLAFETRRLGLQGRAAGSHLTSMHSIDNYYASKLIPLIAEAELHAIPNPLINITIQGRHDTYPKRRGLTRVPELMAAGVNVAFGQDCVLDPWYPLGSHDMLDVAHMAVHACQMTSTAGMRQCFEAVTAAGARAMRLEGYGLEVGAHADLVVLQAQDEAEAIRLRTARLQVLRRGRVIAESAPRLSRVTLGEQTFDVDLGFEP